MPTKIRWGVIGAGGIARRRTIPEGIVPAQNAALGAVFDLNREVGREVGRTFGVRVADSLADLLGPDIDAVYIATPPDAHPAQATACARAGKHVLCEKPLALAPEGAATMVAACAAAGVKLGTAFMMRFHAQHRAALRLIEEGRLGRPVFARAQLSCWYPPIPGAWRQDPAIGGGGSLIDLGGHCIDLLEMFFGGVTAVTCATNRIIHEYPVEDGAVATLHFENGALGVVDAFFCVPDESSKNVLELYGSQGSILAQGTIGQSDSGQMTAYLKNHASGYDAMQARSSSEARSITPTPVNVYRAEIEEFSDAILNDRKPAAHAEIGLRSQRVLDALYQSARIGARVMI